MLRRLMKRLVPALEKRLGVRLEYMRRMADSAPGALWRFGLFMPLAGYGRVVPPRLLHLARLGATLAADCGECVEITMNVARQEGVAPDVLRAGLVRDEDVLSVVELDALDYGAAVAAGDPRSDTLRRALAAEFGEEGIIELSIAVATAQLFTTVKLGMGLNQACDVGRLSELAA